MINRKNNFLYLLLSIFIHIVLLLGLFWFSPSDEAQPKFRGKFEVDIVMLPRSEVVKPPVKTDIPTPDINTAPIIDEVEIAPTPSKPSIDLETDFLSVEQEQDYAPTDRIHKQENRVIEGTESLSNSIVSNRKNAKNPYINTKSVKLDRELFTISSTSESTPTKPIAETDTIQLDTEKGLNDVSLTAGTPRIHYGSRRGDAFRSSGMSNSWGGGGTSGSNNVGGIYVKMMRDIAMQLVAATTTEKVDVVFVLDETASMVDNIRGIRAYFGYIFDALELDGRDTTFGLVTFTDRVKTYGRTDDLGKFKNWLFNIDVDRGGDISEAGLDALMTAVEKIKFRQNAQRFFVFASDAAFHDADYDGRSEYSLDETIATLQKEQIRVEVIGLDYLPVKQIALGTGGTWRAIPGKGFMEYIPPITLTEKMLSKLGTLSKDGGNVGDTITVHVNNPPRPKQLVLTWKVLNPLGERCYGPFTEKRDISDDATSYVVMTPELDTSSFLSIPGIYTVIYRLANDRGHKSILRRTITH
ncbi:MAG: VWA domain-containing protein [Candidatus Poribacteria bacterium]|nr:VWA domain-containing protein [Candidatus Poribacteria bacterium]